MKKFLVISNHTGPDCIKALKETLAIGYLNHFDWGCKDGVHTGWAILEAEDKEQAMLSVPTFLRGHAQVVQLTRFQPDKVEAMHEK
jgi:N-dimethylarginine dimethylaminohydrolase